MPQENILALVAGLLLASCLPPLGSTGAGGAGGGGGALPPAEWIATFSYDQSNIHVANNCQDSIGVSSGSYYDSSAGIAGMNPNTAIDVSRNAEGPTMIWLSTGEQISVGPEVRVVEVDASCRNLVPYN